MIIKSISINNKKFSFTNNKNIITSSKNSVGKTSLVRMLLYSIGYDIPSTKGFNFKKMDFKTIVEISNDTYIFYRSDDHLLIKNLAKSNNLTFSVRLDKSEILSILYGTTNILVLKNILGTHYFDQEKGWTLLNRGKVIGNIRYNIEEVIQGLTSDKMLELREKLKELKNERMTYMKIKPLLELNKEYSNESFDYSDLNPDKLDDKISSIKMNINIVKNRISTYKQIFNDNEKFINFIDSTKLKIKTEDNKVQIIRKKDIIGFKPNQDIITAQITRYKRNLDSLEKNLNNLQMKQERSLSLISLSSQLDKFNIALSKLNLSSDAINEIIELYKKKIDQINEKIKNNLYNKKITNNVYKRIKKYAQILNISKEIQKNTNFIFTSELKKYSGAQLHLLVFAFRLALLKEIQNKYDIYPPIILDSPMSSELDINNMKKMFNLLNTEFKDNQIIVATIEDLYDIGGFNNKIYLDKKLFE